jgi:hypothetical protein
VVLEGVLAEFFLMMPPIENVEHQDKIRKKLVLNIPGVNQITYCKSKCVQ